MTDAEFTYQLIAAGSLLGNAALIWRAVRGGSEKREISPDPLNVQKSPRVITETEFEPLQRRVDIHEARISRLSSDLSERATRDEVGELHEKINGVAQDVAAIKAVTESLNGLPERLAKDIGLLFGQIQHRK